MKNFSDTIGNRTYDLAACSAVPQPTAPPRASTFLSNVFIIKYICTVRVHVIVQSKHQGTSTFCTENGTAFAYAS